MSATGAPGAIDGRLRWVAVVGLVTLAVLVGVRLWSGPLLAAVPGQRAAGAELGGGRAESRGPSDSARSAPTADPGRGARGGGATTPMVPGEPAPRDRSLTDAEARRERDRFTLASYLEWSQYPPSSRPARERPDRLRPHASSARTLPLASPGGADGRETDGSPDKGAATTRVVLWQSHVHLAGAEAATFSVACRRDDVPVACAVRSAVATPESPSPGFAPVPVAFADDGHAPDRVAGDGVSTATLAPGARGFGAFSGPLRLTVDIEAAPPPPATTGPLPAPLASSTTGPLPAVPERGTVTFALLYTATPPAVFTGTVRERLAAGSLELCVGLSVREPGRYLLDARVDDASGETFAFLSFDGPLPVGAQEACFQLFGKLVRDEARAAPFTLRDVEGSLFLEDTFPDRRTLATLEGVVHTTAPYELEDFSGATWKSDTKSRHVAALQGRDPPQDDAAE